MNFSLVLGHALSASQHKVVYPNAVGHKKVSGTNSKVGVVKKHKSGKGKVNVRKAQKKFKKQNLKVRHGWIKFFFYFSEINWINDEILLIILWLKMLHSFEN